MLQVVLGAGVAAEAGVGLRGALAQQLQRARVLALGLVQDDELAALAVLLQRALRLLQPAVVEAQQRRHERVVSLPGPYNHKIFDWCGFSHFL